VCDEIEATWDAGSKLTLWKQEFRCVIAKDGDGKSCSDVLCCTGSDFVKVVEVFVERNEVTAIEGGVACCWNVIEHNLRECGEIVEAWVGQRSSWWIVCLSLSLWPEVGMLHNPSGGRLGRKMGLELCHRLCFVWCS
jgi:hypothetical protein